MGTGDGDGSVSSRPVVIAGDHGYAGEGCGSLAMTDRQIMNTMNKEGAGTLLV